MKFEDDDFEQAFRDSDRLMDADDHFDEEALEDINFSEIQGKNFKKSFSSVNKKMKQASKKKKKPHVLNKSFGVKQRATIHGGKKPITKVLIPRENKVIVEGVDQFILSGEYDAAKRIGWHEGRKLKETVLIFNNDSGVDFDLELFNPSMPLDYLFSTSLSLNDKIQVAGGAVSYTDVLFNILANPILVYNAKFIISGPTQSQQIAQSLSFINKNTQGVEKVDPINLMLHVDNMQVEGNHISFFDITKNLHRPFIPDGMDVIRYRVLAGNTITMCFYGRQPLLKNRLFEEAKYNKNLI